MVSAPETVAAVLRISVHDLRHGPNARGDLGDVTELVESLRAIGQQVPAIVERLDDSTWSVFDGNRRLKAARAAGFAHLLCIARTTPLSDVERVVRQLSMHGSARQFDPIAEAKAVEWLMFAESGPHLSREEIAKKLGRSPGWVKGRIDLLRLDADEQLSISKGTLSVRDGVAMVTARRNGALGPAARRAAERCDGYPRCGCLCHKPKRRS